MNMVYSDILAKIRWEGKNPTIYCRKTTPK